jgi:hypothetical protein
MSPVAAGHRPKDGRDNNNFIFQKLILFSALPPDPSSAISPIIREIIYVKPHLLIISVIEVFCETYKVLT